MKVQVFSRTDASFERSPGLDGDVFAANLIDERHGGPVTTGYGRYGPHQRLHETMAVDDVMIVLEGQLTITSNDDEKTAVPGDIVYMPKGETVEIRAQQQGALTAYVTCPHWKLARAPADT
jgi:ethanolamine utilization protein EutQ (cupin superfamily)